MDGLYDHDVLTWSEQQADLLRRLAAGERVNDSVDWANVIEEIETVGRSELHACESLLFQALVHLQKLHARPTDDAAPHWRGEAVGFLLQARRAYAPSMRQRIDLAGLYADAVQRVRASEAEPGVALQPASCPYALDDLLAAEANLSALTARLGASLPR